MGLNGLKGTYHLVANLEDILVANQSLTFPSFIRVYLCSFHPWLHQVFFSGYNEGILSVFKDSGD